MQNEKRKKDITHSEKEIIALRTIDACGDKRVLEKQMPNECIQAGSLEHYRNDQMNRYYDPQGISPTITVVSGGGREQKIMDSYRIRKLTPLECWRLMGFDDEHFKRAADAGVSNSQLYKQAGNSIVVDVLEHIFMNLFKGEYRDWETDRKSTRLNSSHEIPSRMPSSA